MAGTDSATTDPDCSISPTDVPTSFIAAAGVGATITEVVAALAPHGSLYVHHDDAAAIAGARAFSDVASSAAAAAACDTTAAAEAVDDHTGAVASAPVSSTAAYHVATAAAAAGGLTGLLDRSPLPRSGWCGCRGFRHHCHRC